MNNQFEEMKSIYIDNLKNGEIPVLPAYYYYLENTSNIDLLDQRRFAKLFLRGVEGYQNRISFDMQPPEMDIEVIVKTLNDYFNIVYLYNENLELTHII